MKKILSILLLFLAFNGFSQQDFIMYGLQDIPQSTYSNPSNRYDGKFFIGFPALTSHYFSFSNSGFSYSDAVSKKGDSLYLNFDDLLKEIDDKNYLSINSKTDLLAFGFSLGDKTQLTFNVTENMNFKFVYPKDFIQFITKGNASFNGETANFDGIGFGANHYREYGVGISRQITNKLRIGLRGKYLYGMENIYSEKTDISLTTDSSTFEILAEADITYRTSGLNTTDNAKDDIVDYLSGRDNTGFAADFGADYQFNDKLSFNASVLDIGYINWNHDIETQSNNGGTFNFSGIEIDAFGSRDTSSEVFDEILDSLENTFELTESNESYTTKLTPRIYIGANYKLSERHMAGFLIQTEVFQGTVKPSFTLTYNRKMTKWITLASSYSYFNNSYSNLGFGFSLDPGPVQFYVISDNLLGAFQPQNTRHLQVRFGMNLIFGREKSKELRPPYNPLKSNDDKKEKKEKKVKKEAKEEKEKTPEQEIQE
jgi:hypothetical protein